MVCFGLTGLMTRGTICVVQARSGSTRFPGKVLADLAGRTMLGFMLERLATLEGARVVVATSDLERDDPVAQVGADAGAAVVRGPEADVLERFGLALEAHPADTVVRLTGDCPLVDPAIVADVLALHRATGADYTCNVLPRTFPKGLDVEALSAAALEEAVAEATDPAEREHVTPYVYRRPGRFRLANLRSGEDLGRERWTVDTPEDLEVVRELVGALGADAAFGWRDVLAVAGAPAPRAGLVLRPATPADSDRVLAWRNDPEAVRWSRTGRVEPAQHAAWYAARLEDPASRVLIADLDGEPIGMARVDVTDGIGEVSTALAPEHRGRGLGTRVLATLVAESLSDQQVVALRASIHPSNEGSLRAFTRAGFVPGDDEDVHGFTVLRCLTSDREGVA